jgi:hypothetical protein
LPDASATIRSTASGAPPLASIVFTNVVAAFFDKPTSGTRDTTRPQIRKRLIDVGPREREDEDRLLRAVEQHVLDELHRRQVAPLKILEHDHHGPARALAAHPRRPRAPDAIAHQARIAPRRRDLLRRVGDAEAGDLRDEVGDVRLAFGDDRPDARRELVPPLGGIVSLFDPHLATQRRAERRERRARRRRVRLRAQEERGRLLLRRRERRERFVEKARLPEARVARDEHRARHAAVADVGPRREERRQLARAPHERRGLSEKRVLSTHLRAPPERVRVLASAARDLEVRAEETRGRVVDHDRHRADGHLLQDLSRLSSQEARGALEHTGISRR